VSCASYALVIATVGVGTVLIPYFGVAITKGGGTLSLRTPELMQWNDDCAQTMENQWMGSCGPVSHVRVWEVIVAGFEREG
jgi:hypothetical protein